MAFKVPVARNYKPFWGQPQEKANKPLFWTALIFVKDYYQQQPRRSYEMEDIYGQRGNGMARYAQNNPAFNANQFGNYNQQQPQEAFDPYNQQNPQQNFYQQQQVKTQNPCENIE